MWKGAESLRRLLKCLVAASAVTLLMLFLLPEGPPPQDALRIWLYAHLGPILMLSSSSWRAGITTVLICLLLILPSLFSRDDWFTSLCTGGFFLWLIAGVFAIGATL